ncbi:hypothetical protein Pint_04467 [Pistacia integerrima]|uniref:Uncharacterized protein n=1 Tax=Pistacia integerrima TaxID=434235 RepID=A0ACC0Z563_9ROSI|nr:hypothetical protein Pint_04467 [Pistacia integerrima]
MKSSLLYSYSNEKSEARIAEAPTEPTSSSQSLTPPKE